MSEVVGGCLELDWSLICFAIAIIQSEGPLWSIQARPRLIVFSPQSVDIQDDTTPTGLTTICTSSVAELVAQLHLISHKSSKSYFTLQQVKSRWLFCSKLVKTSYKYKLVTFLSSNWDASHRWVHFYTPPPAPVEKVDHVLTFFVKLFIFHLIIYTPLHKLFKPPHSWHSPDSGWCDLIGWTKLVGK